MNVKEILVQMTLDEKATILTGTEISVDIDERTMREICLRGFEIAIKRGHPTSLMCAYNKIHSLWCSENYCLLTEILRHDWGYDGMVVSDWGAVHHGARPSRQASTCACPATPTPSAT